MRGFSEDRAQDDLIMLIATRFRSIVGGAAFVTLALAGAYAGDARSPSSHEGVIVRTASEEQTVEGFEARLKKYMRVHRKLEATLPKLPKHATPEQVDESQRALDALIKTARAGAKQGEFFTPDMQALVKRTLEADLAGPDGKTIKALIMDENPGVPTLAVNDRYPDAIPVSTMPHKVLRSLPKLEEDLEYRFVGKRLVLMDAEARIILDFTDDVLP
jgi:hypothetical protein